MARAKKAKEKTPEEKLHIRIDSKPLTRVFHRDSEEHGFEAFAFILEPIFTCNLPNVLEKNSPHLLLTTVISDLYQILSCQNIEHNRLTFVYHLTDKPLDFDGCTELYLQKVLGLPHADVWHSYSDLTGYLYTNLHIKHHGDKFTSTGHDIYQEISTTFTKYHTKCLKEKKMKRNDGDPIIYLSLDIQEH